MSYPITKLKAREVLDSRGNPAIEVEAYSGKDSARAIVPSGASTGIYEALELRDHDERFHGKGVQKAIANVKLIEKKIRGIDAAKQKEIDSIMIEADGTVKKTQLGANAILGVSMAAARLAARCKGIPLHAHLARLYGNRKPILPVPFCNVLNGGKHAGGKLAMQEFMIAPIKARTFADATRMVSETYQQLRMVIRDRYGASAINVGDEGGFAPPISKPEEALSLIEKAIKASGYEGKVAMALDPAASEFYDRKKNVYMVNKPLSSDALSKYYMRLASRYDIISIEDPFEQDDLDAFASFRKSAKFQVVGDDLLVTSVDRIAMAIEKNLCNALLLKVNQVGTITESMAASSLAMAHRWKVMVSHRSGETEDPFISDLTVALGSGQMKIGAPCRGERTAKYNQLIRIEEELGNKARYAKF